MPGKAPLSAEHRRFLTTETNRAAWVRAARGLCSALAAAAYGMPNGTPRHEAMHSTIRELAGDYVRTDSAARAPAERLAAHAEATPFGFARYGGAVLRATLLDLPHVLDRLSEDRGAE